MSVLLLTDLEKAFDGAPVLNGVTLEVDGGVTAILGPSGCGKTTLLRLVAGFLRPDRGSIRIDGTEVSGGSVHRRPEERRLGYLAQEGALFPHLTVAQNIAFGLPRRARRDAGRLRHLLTLVSLDADLAGRYPHELSGGQQQRVALARTLAPEPRLVLLDEPFSALDASLRAETRALVAAALAAADVTTVLVTHDQGEALSFADQIAVMRAGTVTQIGAPHHVYDNPVDLATAEFVGDTCTLPALVAGGIAATPLGDIEVRDPPGGRAADGLATLMLRPEQLHIGPAGEEPASGVLGIVCGVEYFGHDCVVTAEVRAVSTQPAVTVNCRLIGGSRLSVGSSARISVSGSALAYPIDARTAVGR